MTGGNVAAGHGIDHGRARQTRSREGDQLVALAAREELVKQDGGRALQSRDHARLALGQMDGGPHRHPQRIRLESNGGRAEVQRLARHGHAIEKGGRNRIDHGRRQFHRIVSAGQIALEMVGLHAAREVQGDPVAHRSREIDGQRHRLFQRGKISSATQPSRVRCMPSRNCCVPSPSITRCTIGNTRKKEGSRAHRAGSILYV